MRFKLLLITLPFIVTVKSVVIDSEATGLPNDGDQVPRRLVNENIVAPIRMIPRPQPRPIYVRPLNPPAVTDESEAITGQPTLPPIPGQLPNRQPYIPRPIITSPSPVLSETNDKLIVSTTGRPDYTRPSRVPPPRPVPKPIHIRPITTPEPVTEIPSIEIASTPKVEGSDDSSDPDGIVVDPPSVKPVQRPWLRPILQPAPRPAPRPMRPEPEPVADLEPLPQPEPAPQPQPIPEPEPKPEPQPEPEPEPQPEPEPEPQPEPEPEPQPELKPIPALTPESKPDDVLESRLEKLPEDIWFRPAPRPTVRPIQQPVLRPAPRPTLRPAPVQPVTRPINTTPLPPPKVTEKNVEPEQKPVENPNKPIKRPVVPKPQPTPKPVVITPRPIKPPKPTVTPKPGPYDPSRLIPNANPILGDIGVEVDYKCLADGYYIVNNECDAFIECKKRSALKYVCPDGLQFNSKAVWPEYPCAYPSEVQCERGAVDHVPQPTAECPRQYGFFALKDGDCSRYINCQEGLATIMNCPPGLVFNSLQSACDWPENVPNCKPAIFQGFSCPPTPTDEYGEPYDWIYKYRYGKSCKQYVACQRGHPRLLSCDTGLAFDEESETCIDADYVANCSLSDLVKQ